MPSSSDLHNSLIAPVVTSIVKPLVEGGGQPADVLVLLESVITGVLLFFDAEPGAVMDKLKPGVCARFAEVQAKQKARAN